MYNNIPPLGVYDLYQITGKCDCGSVHFECTQQPINSVFCYCTSCQQRTNSDKWFGIWIPKSGFKITQGKTSTFVRKGSSGKNMEHHYCNECGNNLAVFVEAGGFYTVSVSTLDNKNDFSPTMAIYTQSAPKWAVFPKNIPSFDTIPETQS